MSDTLRAIAAAAAISVSLFVGLLGLYCFFADFSPNETMIERGLFLLVCYTVSGVLFGALIPQRWYGALLAAWGPVLIAIPGLLSKLINRGPYPYWSYLALPLVIVPGICLASGYVGARLRRKMERSDQSEDRKDE